MNREWNKKAIHAQYNLPEFKADENLVKVDFWDFFMFASWGGYGENWGSGEYTLPLNNNEVKDKLLTVKKHFYYKFTNNFPFPIFNLSIYFLKEKKEVFFWKSIPANRFLKLKFLKNGIYNLYFNFPEIENTKDGCLKLSVV